MSERGLPYGAININCQCCGLLRRVRDRDGNVPKLCDECAQHQGQLPERRAQRAEEHERELRRWLDACRASEAKSRRVADAAGDRIASALASRGALASRLYEAGQRAGHSCPTSQIALDPKVIRWAQVHREISRSSRGYLSYEDDE